MKGLPANIYKHGGNTSSNGGLSSTVDEVTIVGIVYPDRRATDENIEPVIAEAQVFEPTDKAPPVVIVHRNGMPPYAAAALVIPATGDIAFVKPERAVGPMMGGCYIGGSDSRFRDLAGTYAPIALHDRFETAQQATTASAD